MTRNRTSFTSRPLNAGRQKGDVSRKSRELKDFFCKFLSSAEYMTSLKARMLRGKAPHIELYAFTLLCGRAPERITLENITPPDEHERLVEALTERIQKIVDARKNITDITPDETPQRLLDIDSQVESIESEGETGEAEEGHP